jgi:TonB family protein
LGINREDSMKHLLVAVALLFALPTTAKDAPDDGTVTVEVLIAPDGKAKEARVVSTTLSQQHNDAALDLAKRWQYKTSTTERNETRVFTFKKEPQR